MGNDGGSIPKRGDMVRTKSKAASVEKDQLNFEKWNLCALSMRPLQKPIVACRLGRLYNKEAIINLLLDRDQYSEVAEAFSHIKGLKDVKELTLKESLDKKPEDGKSVSFVCPVTGKEMNGKGRFFYYKTCGCTMSYSSLDVSKEPENSCLSCGKPVNNETDQITLNGSSEEVKALKEKLSMEISTKRPKKTNIKKIKDEEPVEEAIHAGPRKRENLVSTGEILALKRNKNIDELYMKR